MTEKMRQLRARLRDLEQQKRSAGDYRDWNSIDILDEAIARVKRQISRLDKGKTMPDFFGGLEKYLGVDSDKKAMLQEMEGTVRDIGAHIHFFSDSLLRGRLLDDPTAMINITVCSTADRSGRDLRITLELTHSVNGERERLVTDHILVKRDLR